MTRIVAGCAAAALLLTAGCTSSKGHRAATPSSRRSRTTASKAAPRRRPARRSSPPPSPTPNPVVAARADRSGGRVVRVTIPSSTTFRPGPAYVYLPPAQRAHPTRALPVLELLHGTPGLPIDWFDRGGLLATADAFAAAHGGMAPVIVVPDINGARRADSECIRTTYGGDVETYLTRDVVRWVRSRYAPTVGTRRWWVAGLSEGGLCSIVLTLRHPSVYSAFGDFSGLVRPIVEHLSVAESNRVLYGNSTSARLQHDPSWLLAHRTYRGLYGWFATGASDKKTLDAQTVLARGVRAEHLPVHTETRPGKHEWTVWTYELRAVLPWLWARARG